MKLGYVLNGKNSSKIPDDYIPDIESIFLFTKTIDYLRNIELMGGRVFRPSKSKKEFQIELSMGIGYSKVWVTTN